MITKEEELGTLENLMESTKRIHKSHTCSSPTLNTHVFVSSLLFAFFVTWNINGIHGYPLARETESNNNLLNWWASTTSSEEVARQMDNLEGIEHSTKADQTLQENLDFVLDDGNDKLPGLDSEESSGINPMSGLIRQREKKGLSYLSKFYSEAMLHSNRGNGGNSSSKESHFYGEGYGLGNGLGFVATTRSGEHTRLPSNVRRKLSFYPPLTFMTPWRSILMGNATNGKNAAVRLRWGK